MTSDNRYKIELPPVLVLEPTEDEVKLSAERLAAWYNDPENRRLMTSVEFTLADEVPAIYSARVAEGGRNFLIFSGDRLIGDADLREMDPRGGQAEFAVMIGEADDRGRGLGTKAAAAVHHFAFSVLNLKRLYLSVAAYNHAAIRSYRKLGYLEILPSEGTAHLKEHPDDVLMSVERERFYGLQPLAKSNLISVRT